MSLDNHETGNQMKKMSCSVSVKYTLVMFKRSLTSESVCLFVCLFFSLCFSLTVWMEIRNKYFAFIHNLILEKQTKKKERKKQTNKQNSQKNKNKNKNKNKTKTKTKKPTTTT